MLDIGKRIQSEIHQKMSKSQRDHYLRQQLKAIKKELGETDDPSSEAEDYADRIEKADMPEEARKEASANWSGCSRCRRSQPSIRSSRPTSTG
jgi:ATP-dependent Lon protease